MVFLIVLATYAGLFYSDMRPVLQTKKPGLIWPCALLFAAALAVQVLHEYRVDIPSPAPYIAGFITAVFNVH